MDAGADEVYPLIAVLGSLEMEREEESSHSGPLFQQALEFSPEEASRAAALRVKIERLRLMREGKSKILGSQERSWLRKHGKKQFIDFDDETRAQLRSYFLAMDEDQSGYISIEELLDPLVALGLAETRDEVQQLFDVVDTDKSNKIEFDEFLAILKCGEAAAPMAQFFKEMARGGLLPNAQNLPFNLVVSNYRRKLLLDGILHNDPRGEKVVRAFTRMRGEYRGRALSLSAEHPPASHH